ncbi:ABC transporter substrate-binding protein [Undibacterium terreum]|uniref:Aliphatic sulfonate ABC transporter substrate-binding protein n=1 Tax=Undibacterium terreum TaxID=1224302 RepID=A0A916XI06_9BURK|nr:ABC transporter substrate-binding protein [Undibacterium terreum]GGC73456.1 aliphatic sulfonate ABC transporter substrate-binding protein [Undibacterium terreum]
MHPLSTTCHTAFQILARKHALCAVMLFAAMCCRPPAAQAEPLKTVVYASGTAVPSTVILVAQEQGYFAREGLEVRIENCIGAFRCMLDMMEGKAQFSSAGDLAVMFNGVDRKDFVILATYSSSTSLLKLVTRKSAHIEKAQDLVGKRVGIIKRSASHYFLDNFLLLEGVEPKSVEHVFLDQEDMSAALQNGSVDAISTFEPVAGKQLAAIGKDGFEVSVPPYNLSTHLVAMRKTAMQSRTETIKLLRAMDRAVQFIAAEPKKAKAILARRSGMDAASVDAVWAGSQFKLVLDPSLQVTLNSVARWARNENLISDTQIPEFSNFIYPEPLNAAKAKGVGK